MSLVTDWPGFPRYEDHLHVAYHSDTVPPPTPGRYNLEHQARQENSQRKDSGL